MEYINGGDGKIYEMRPDGSDKQEWVPVLPDYMSLRDDDSPYMDNCGCSNFIYSDGWVYFRYIYETSWIITEFYKMRPDGSGLERLFDRGSDETEYHITGISDGWIYFTESCYDDWTIDWKIRTDGTDLQKVNQSE